MINPPRILTRRRMIAGSALATGALCLPRVAGAAEKKDSKQGMRFGLVTYMWGAGWDLPTLIANCEKAGALGVELRSTHAHRVEPSLTKAKRAEVKRRFADSSVTCLGPGSNERFDNPDPKIVKQAIERTQQFVLLSHDIGGSGVKVKPDRFYKNVPREKTIAQIGKSLNEVGTFAANHGQEIRLEIHGGCAELPTIAAIMKIADNPAVKVCWNCNAQDLQGRGLEHNFNLVKDRFGDTLHIHELGKRKYPYQELFKLLKSDHYTGWVLLEASPKPGDPVRRLTEQRKLFHKMVSQAT